MEMPQEPSWIKRALSGIFRNSRKPALKWFPDYKDYNGSPFSSGNISHRSSNGSNIFFGDEHGHGIAFNKVGNKEPPPPSSSSENEEDMDEKQRRLRTRKMRLIVITVLVFALIISAVVAVAVVLTSMSDDDTSPERVVSMSVRVTSHNYTEDMADSSSATFLAFEEEFCSQVVNTSFGKSSETEKYRNCSVTSLQNGSVVVIFSINAIPASPSMSTALFVAVIIINKESLRLTGWEFEDRSVSVMSVVPSPTQPTSPSVDDPIEPASPSSADVSTSASVFSTAKDVTRPTTHATDAQESTTKGKSAGEMEPTSIGQSAIASEAPTTEQSTTKETTHNY